MLCFTDIYLVKYVKNLGNITPLACANVLISWNPCSISSGGNKANTAVICTHNLAAILCCT